MSVGILVRECIVVPPGWSRWLILLAVLAIHFAIGQAYAWSVFKIVVSAQSSLGVFGTVSAIPFQLGIVMLGRDGAAGVVGKTLVIFATACMVVAGLVLASTGKKYWRAAAIQLVPAALALVLVLLV